MSERDLPPIPDRMRGRPRDERGYPIPYAQFLDRHGKPDFRILDDGRVVACLEARLCGLCGQPMGRHLQPHERRQAHTGLSCSATRGGSSGRPPRADETFALALKRESGGDLETGRPSFIGRTIGGDRTAVTHVLSIRRGRSSAVLAAVRA
jgi:hypothetical protein